MKNTKNEKKYPAELEAPPEVDEYGWRWNGLSASSLIGLVRIEPDRISTQVVSQDVDGLSVRLPAGVYARLLDRAGLLPKAEVHETEASAESAEAGTYSTQCASLQDRINELESELSRWRFLGQEIVLGQTATDLFEVTPERCREKLRANGSSSVQVTYRVAYGSVLLNSGEVLDRAGNLLRIVKRDVDGRGPQAVMQYGNHEGALLADVLALAADRGFVPGRCVSPKSKLDTSTHALIRHLTEQYGSRAAVRSRLSSVHTIRNRVLRVLELYQQELTESAKLEKESDR